MPPNPLSMYQSSGQTFTQRGRPGATGVTYARDKIGDFRGAIADMAALNSRLLVTTQRSAIQLADALTDNTKNAIRRHMPRQPRHSRDPTTGEAFEFSKGRLAAAWGRYTPEDMAGAMSDSNPNESIEEVHERWAAQNGVVGEGVVEGRDMGEEREVNMGAITEIKRIKGNVWTAEVGTFLPYAGLANDGGTMEIHPYGNPELSVDATWEGVHFIEEGISMTEGQVENIVEGSIQSALNAQPERRRVRNPGRRRGRG